MCDKKEKIEKSILMSLSFCQDYVNDIFYDKTNDNKIIICLSVKPDLISNIELFKQIEEKIYKNLLFFEELLQLNFFLNFRVESTGCGAIHCSRQKCEKNPLIISGDQKYDPLKIRLS